MINDLLIVLDDIFSSKLINNKLKMKIIKKIGLRDCNIILKTKYIKEYIIKNINSNIDFFRWIFYLDIDNDLIIYIMNRIKLNTINIKFILKNFHMIAQDATINNNAILIIKLLIEYGYKDNINFDKILFNYTYNCDYGLYTNKIINNCKYLIHNSKLISNNFYTHILDYSFKKFFIWLNDNEGVLGIMNKKLYIKSYNLKYKLYKFLINLNIKWKYFVYNSRTKYSTKFLIYNAKICKYLIHKEELNFRNYIILNKTGRRYKLIYNINKNSNYVLNFIFANLN